MTEQSVKRVKLLLTGLVQGVFFRVNAQDQAKKLGLTGYVKNLSNGQVEAVFEGPEDKIDDIIYWIKQGPASSRIDQLDIIQEKPANLTSFEIIR